MRIYLRPITPEDGELIVKWRNSPNVRRHCFSRETVTEESNRIFFEENVVTGKYQQYIVERIDEQYGVASYPIATVYLKDIDNYNKRCELCIFTSDDGEWNEESQSIAIRMLVEKAFDELGMHKVYSYVFYRFFDEAQLLKNAGFEVETILRKEAIDENGVYEDVLRFCVIKE